MTYRTVIASLADPSSLASVVDTAQDLVDPSGTIVLVDGASHDAATPDTSAHVDHSVPGLPPSTGPAMPAIAPPTFGTTTAPDLLDAARQRLAGRTFSVLTAPGDDDVADDLDAAARRHDADLIVVPAESQGLLGRLFRSSPVERLATTAPCPVLVLR